ncbi:MAG: YlbF family regulator [Chloroflexi bacterium]|nr:YlbF family regulator [Chloroflexota bacterium]
MMLNRLPSNVETTAKTLIESLLRTPTMVDVQQAKRSLDEDAETQALLKRYATAQSDLRSRQTSGSITQQDINFLRELQLQVQTNSKVIAFVEAQRFARFLLDETSSQLGEALGIDFTAMSAASCC